MTINVTGIPIRQDWTPTGFDAARGTWFLVHNRHRQIIVCQIVGGQWKYLHRLGKYTEPPF